VVKALRYKKNIRSPFPVLGLIEGQTNCLKKRSEKLFTFPKTFENILQTIFFQAAIFIDPQMMTPTPNRSPSQVVISAFRMVIWVIF
jgi:hypothetical protein